MEILRTDVLHALEQRLEAYPVVAILGPRQCGKSTLSRQYLKHHSKGPTHQLDLENPRDLAALDEPMLTLEKLKGLVVIDEIQRRPELFPILRVLADRRPNPCQFLILGSASRDLIAQSSETLAGRISYLEMGGFTTRLLPPDQLERLWLRGGFPSSYLAKTQAASCQWRRDFISTFLERDIPNLGLRIPPRTLRQFWMMAAHFHGQVVNLAELGRSADLSEATIRRYLDIMAGTFMFRLLRPWHSNSKKRLVKRPKLYFRDSGIFHSLSSIETQNDLEGHPRKGASWEGFALEQTLARWDVSQDEAYFWGAHTGAELDLLINRGSRKFGVEFKYTDAPRQTPSMLAALKELGLKHLWVVYPGPKTFPIHPKITAIPLDQLEQMTI